MRAFELVATKADQGIADMLGDLSEARCAIRFGWPASRDEGAATLEPICHSTGQLNRDADQGRSSSPAAAAPSSLLDIVVPALLGALLGLGLWLAYTEGGW